MLAYLYLYLRNENKKSANNFCYFCNYNLAKRYLEFQSHILSFVSAYKLIDLKILEFYFNTAHN